jgi:hypothetical protein
MKQMTEKAKDYLMKCIDAVEPDHVGPVAVMGAQHGFLCFVGLDADEFSNLLGFFQYYMKTKGVEIEKIV